MKVNRELIAKGIEDIAAQVNKIDKAILKEAKTLTENGVNPKSLEKINNLSKEREKLKHTEFNYWAILGQWRD